MTQATDRRPTTRPALLFARALTLRCPNCGSGGLFASWFQLREACPRCGLRPERGERDYFLGAYLFNLIIVELLATALPLAIVIATWPAPPWTALEYGAVVLMGLGAVVCSRFAKTTWLAFDLALRPLTEEELAWHRAGAPETGAPLPQR